MPKKLSTNQKSVDARARKDAAKQAEKDRVQKAKDDEFWRDDDKQNAKKQARKDERERKEAEERERKKEREKLLQEEMSQLKGKEASKEASQKITRAQIERSLIAMNSATPSKDNNVVQQDLVLENLNRIESDGDTARNLDEAINLLENIRVGEPALDRHPERRLKAAWEAFEASKLPALKAENPNMRLSQIRQMIRKSWQRSPENPLNQRVLAYNTNASRQADDEQPSVRKDSM